MPDSEAPAGSALKVAPVHDAADPLIMGHVSGVHGVRGWMKIFSFTAPPENILSYPVWHLRGEDGWMPRRLLDGRASGKRVLALLEDCVDRDQAAMLVGRDIAVFRDELPEAGPGEFYWADLVGLRVRTLAGVELGRVDHLLETGANDVLVVLGDRERLIPFVQGPVVKQVDVESGEMIVDWDPAF